MGEIAQYIVNTKDLTSVADAIRQKASITSSLEFPAGFVKEINNISTGGSATEPYLEETYDSRGNVTKSIFHGYTVVRPYMYYTASHLNTVKLSDTITTIGILAFGSCTGLKAVALPTSLTTIGNGAFNTCISLKEIDIPANVTKVDVNAFAYCTRLAKAVFKGTPTSLHDTTFSGCDALTEIYVPWSEGEVAGAPWGATNATITYNYTE